MTRVFADRKCLLQPSGYLKWNKRELLPHWVGVQVDLSISILVLPIGNEIAIGNKRIKNSQQIIVIRKLADVLNNVKVLISIKSYKRSLERYFFGRGTP